jgi:hypothetical protein
LNYQGTASEVSASLLFTTSARTENTSAVQNVKQAGSLFTVECTSDICVGDTILITERLYLRPKDVEKQERAEKEKAAGVRPRSAGATASVAGSRAGGVRSSGASVSGAASVAASMNMSVTSITDNDGVSITAAHGTFVGERTIAAFVCRDNYRSTRDQLVRRGITPGHVKEFSSVRKLWLEVIWQKGSNEACKRYEVKPGDVMERVQGHLEQFEVFRCKWKQEQARQSLMQEWQALNECYQVMDC